jgi:hypothetical protein
LVSAQHTSASAKIYRFLKTIDFKTKNYSLTELNQAFQHQHPEVGKVKTGLLKIILVKIHGDEVCFIYPKKKNLSQIVCSSVALNLLSSTIKNLESQETIKNCAQILRNECLTYEFNLQDKFCDETDLTTSMENYVADRPLQWSLFFASLLPSYKISENIQRKCDMIFQCFYNVVNDSSKKTPLLIANAQIIHESCRSKTIIRYNLILFFHHCF